MSTLIRFAHLSDWHATTLRGAGSAAWRGKRLSGWASWYFSRRHHHASAVLEAAIRDVRAQAFDRILVTGDLTHISLPAEFEAARRQLEQLGPPEQVFLIPGNHDCYVEVDPAQGWDRWAPYLRGQASAALRALDVELAEAVVDPRDGRAPRHADYPTLRVFGRVALIGLCSVIPTPVFRAGGLLGSEQLARLRRLLIRAEALGLCRVVMIHHPVHPHGEPPRRALWDADALRALLAETGAELVLHGHKHRRRVHLLEGPRRPIPAIGVPSTSSADPRPDRPAQYHLFSVRDAPEGGFVIETSVRGYDANAGAFVALSDRLV
ncbi:MAG: metallophosphoesterase [Myxococcota bacterium]